LSTFHPKEPSCGRNARLVYFLSRPLFALGCLVVMIGLGTGCRRSVSDPESDARPQTEPKQQRQAASAPDKRDDDQPPPGVLPAFNVVSESGIGFERYDDIQGLHRLVEGMGGGIGLLDYDGDGLLDVLMTNGCKLPLLEDDQEHPTELYRNLGGGKFTRVTEQCGLIQYGYAQGCAVGDYNSDGFPDIYIATYGRNALWRNNGDGTFSDVTAEAEADCPLWSTSVGWADFNLDGLLDLYVTNYVLEDDESPRLCPRKGSPDGYMQCPPTLFKAADDMLLVNLGDGRFRDVTREAGITGVDGKGLGLAIFDANRDGRPDIFVANDGMPNFLYVNESPQQVSAEDEGPLELQFQEKGMPLGVALNQQGVAEASMGVACGDYDGDGWYDLLVTHFFAETNTLYRNLGGSGFSEETNSSRLGPPSRMKLGFGTEFIDFDNDGRLDLFVSNGHIDDFSWLNPKESYQMPPQFFRNEGNAGFRDVSQWCGNYFQQAWLGRPVAQGDLDNDGDMDLVIGHQRAPSTVLRNDTVTDAQSVIIKLVGTRSNRSAVGARVEAKSADGSMVREVIGGGSFQASSDRRIHLGLGSCPAIESLRITWPAGTVDKSANIAPGFYLAREGQALLPLP
jgi:hypothetical protein